MINQERAAKTLSDLMPDERADFFVQLWTKQARQTREGRPFTKVIFRDARREASTSVWEGAKWESECREEWQPGSFYKIRGIYRVDMFGGRIDIQRIRPVQEEDTAQGFDPLRCQPTSDVPPEDIHQAILELIDVELAHPQLKQLVQTLYRQHRETLLLLPASLRHHHRFAGGYLQHVYTAAHLAIRVVDLYRDQHPVLYDPPLRDLVIAGCLLHDIGKLRELADPAEGGGQYTPAGELIGHLIQGRDMIREAAEELNLKGDWLLRLEHLILAHQGSPQHGSPRVPQTAEAVLVHLVDRMDGELFRLAESLAEPPLEFSFTSAANPLGRRLYRGEDRSAGYSEPSA